MARYRVGQQIVVTQFVQKGVEYAGRRGFVEIVESRGRYTVLLYETEYNGIKVPECTIDVRENNIRKA
ncbi:hypothetical protein HWB79_gp108 [Streptomyces phage LukeCage]|jgi:hypothetical protein|uniref:Uncharacterized protein n=1 Tax=Streptomyces phage LukeCage TaxID=2283304 RepID=A0A345MGM2_9CAUD|nr:hypothetical protein HWB79_gp108 [Streptomyces phage LukeCage]AXH69703.1 hypothetical protein SEA_LUKECAGE_217 [Streptomyces phage LukeCage]